MIIIDENVDRKLVVKLKDDTSDIISIQENQPGISDKEIVEIAKRYKGLIITEDKDFGELIFSYNL